MSVTTAPGYDHDALATQVKAALVTHINAPGLGMPLAYTSLSAVAYGVSPAITNVTGIFLNGGSDDITVDGRQTNKAGTMQVT
ncbi:hypothetical protein [Enterobacter ludwigii]|uniref:hypothetical protein n=1 Tax=Enterobacter ludwigii TaxID=299767 RepID=UPI003F6E76E7